MSGTVATGRMVGKWRVLGLLGAGAMGVVYDVEHCVTGKRAALKMLKAAGVDAAVMAAKLLSEARLLARQQHPHLVDVYDASEGAEGEAWMVMERLSGQDLSAIIEAGALPPERALAFGEAIASAVACAHAAGVVHRDLKPDNIHVSDSDIVKVIDFGASRFLAGRTLNQRVGTIPYMSPEQLLRPKQVDGRADVWALGLIVHQMVTGRHLFQHAAGAWLPRTQVLQVIQAQTPLSTFSDVDARLRPMLLKATARSPEHRFATMDDFAAAIQQLRLTLHSRHYLPTERLSSAEMTAPTTQCPGDAARTPTDVDPSGHEPPEKRTATEAMPWPPVRDGATIVLATRSAGLLAAGGVSLLCVAVAAGTMLARSDREQDMLRELAPDPTASHQQTSTSIASNEPPLDEPPLDEPPLNPPSPLNSPPIARSVATAPPPPTAVLETGRAAALPASTAVTQGGRPKSPAARRPTNPPPASLKVNW